MKRKIKIKLKMKTKIKLKIVTNMKNKINKKNVLINKKIHDLAVNTGSKI